jgi:hypothetical protein
MRAERYCHRISTTQVPPVITAAPVPGLEPAFTVAAQLGPLEDHGGLERSLFVA